MGRRERWGVIGAILAELDREAGRGPQARLSNVATRANLPYDRLQAYLQDLVAAGFLAGDRFPTLTDKGRSFLDEYRQWQRVLERFGLGEEGRGNPPAARSDGESPPPGEGT